jgi:hypothetical protein
MNAAAGTPPKMHRFSFRFLTDIEFEALTEEVQREYIADAYAVLTSHDFTNGRSVRSLGEFEEQYRRLLRRE